MNEPCCDMRRTFAMALVALSTPTVDMVDLVIDWGTESRPIVLAFRFCPWCGSEQDVEGQVETYERLRDAEDA
tara:strand:+ start:897 stop:1115 length:219 start_codon:yes stop_codon:yes gene_type:complete